MTALGPADFDAVDIGPLSSDGAGAVGDVPSTCDDRHPTVEALVAKFGNAVLGHAIHAGDQCVVWIDPGRNIEVLGWLRDDPDHRYDMMSDVTAVDYGGGRPVNVVYQMFSTLHRRALRVRCELPTDDLTIGSVTGLWSSANWLEREVFDLFGVTFMDHPDLRRILMPDDYAEGHPLRKDFPLRGRFSRAEQTRRALNQDLGHSYLDHDLQVGGEAQRVTWPGPTAAGSGDGSGEAPDGDTS